MAQNGHHTGGERIPELALALESATTADAHFCLNSYYTELARRFDTGFDPDAVPNFDAAEMTPPKGWFVVARLDGAPVGCGALKRLEPGVSEVKRVWTSPAARGRGVAGKIMDELEKIAVQHDMPIVRLDTNQSLKEAMGFYSKRGYVGIEPYNDNSYADYWFEKRF